MRMIPDVLLSVSSPAERKVFDLLKDADLGQGWTAFHSLNCSEHAYKQWAEIDFLVVGPQAILVLEVKGGRVVCTGGVWTYTDRYGRQRTSSEGPYGQARSAMHALRKLLVERYRIAGLDDSVPFGFGVMFPDVDWDIDTPEAPATITADRLMLATSTGVARYLRHLIEYWRTKHPHARSTLDIDTLETIRNSLRPDVDVYPPLTQRIGVALGQMQHLTEEQYERLEVIESNDRVIVSGGAGTGKTFLMMQLARRYSARGQTVVIVVHSELLAAHLRRAVPDRTAIHTLESIKSQRPGPSDVLLVDEGQDLMTFDALNELAAVVKGGLDQGRWCWFMDENNQAGLSGQFDSEALAYLQSGLSGGKPVRLPLRKNCRNTKELIRQIGLWTSADMGKTDVSSAGNSPQVIVVQKGDSPEVAVEQILKKLLDDGVAPEDIAIVTPTVSAPTLFSRLSPALRRLLTPLTVATVVSDLKGRILWGDAAAYKGLERPIALLLAFEGALASEEAAFYVAATRPNYGLWVFASPTLARRLAANQRERLASISQVNR